MRIIVSVGVLTMMCVSIVRAGPTTITPNLPPENSDGYRLTWHDEFDGQSLDESRWHYRTDSKHWSTQLPDNVTVADGLLRIALKKEESQGKAYTGGGVISKQAFRYGYYEARLKCPPGTGGWHTSFWMMAHDAGPGKGGTDPSAAKQEIDVCETNSNNLTHYEANLHKWPTAVHKAFGPVPVKTPDLSADFHVFGCEFAKDKLVFYFDGKEVGRLDPSKIEHNDQHVWLTVIASHLSGTEKVDDRSLPAAVEVDYVRYFEPTSP